MIQEIENSSRMRMTSASERPMTRALLRCSGGNLSARIAMKTRLSMPRTISSSTRVARPIQTFGSARKSMAVYREGAVVKQKNPQAPRLRSQKFPRPEATVPCQPPAEEVRKDRSEFTSSSSSDIQPFPGRNRLYLDRIEFELNA